MAELQRVSSRGEVLEDAGKEYVKRLDVAKCSLGSMDYQYLNLPLDHGVYFKDMDHPLMNANDHHGKKHIMQFGRCKSEMNPKNKASDILGKFIPGIALINMAKDALGCDGCKCTPRTLATWKEDDEHNRLDGAPAIHSDSELVCAYGGIITITEMPEEDAKTGDENEGEEVQEEKDIMDTIPTEMADKIGQMNQEAQMNQQAQMNAMAAMQAGAGAAIGAGFSAGAGAGSGGMGSTGSDLGYGSSAADIQADTKQWYADNANNFAQDYGCTAQMSDQNFMYNNSQMLSPESMNAEGYINNTDALSNFNIAGSNAAAIGKGCAAMFNLLMAIGMPIGFPAVIQEAEKCQTVKGFIDQGPMAAAMCTMAGVAAKKGLKASASFPKKLSKEAVKVNKGEAAMVGLSNTKSKEASFCTIINQGNEMKCKEFPDKPLDEIFVQKKDCNAMVMKISNNSK